MCARRTSGFRSSMICSMPSTTGPASLHGYPARWYVQMRVRLATDGWTRAHSAEKLPQPFSTITVGEPAPMQGHSKHPYVGDVVGRDPFGAGGVNGGGWGRPAWNRRT